MCSNRAASSWTVIACCDLVRLGLRVLFLAGWVEPIDVKKCDCVAIGARSNRALAEVNFYDINVAHITKR